MFDVPFFSSSNNDNQHLNVGDKVRVKIEVPVYSGRLGVLVEIDERYGDYTVQFDDKSQMTYDRDMLRKIEPTSKK